MLSIIANALMTASRTDSGNSTADYRDELRHNLYLDEQRREAQRKCGLALKKDYS